MEIDLKDISPYSSLSPKVSPKKKSLKLSVSSDLEPYVTPPKISEGKQEAQEAEKQTPGQKKLEQEFIRAEEKILKMAQKDVNAQLEILKRLDENKYNIIILSYHHLQRLIDNIEKYKNIKFSNRNVIIGNLITAIQISDFNNFEWDDKNLSLYYKSNIDLLKIEFSKKELNDIFEGNLSKENDYTYIKHFLSNALTNSSRLFFFNETEKNKIVFSIYYLSKNLETGSFGRYFYNYFFSQKYKNITCTIPSYNIDELILQAKEIDRFVYEKRKEEKYQYYIFVRSLVENYDYNCNLYYLLLLSEAARGTNQFIEYDFQRKSEKFYVNDEFYNQFKQCMMSSKNFILIPFIIYFEKNGHQNILLVDKRNKRVEKFEPHGLELYDVIDIEKNLSRFFKDYDLDYTSYTCTQGIQTLEHYIPERYGGKCVSLSFGYLDFRLRQEVSDPVDAGIAYYNYAIEKQLLFFKELKERNDFIFNALNPELSLINKTFGTSLIFFGNILSFKRESCKKTGKHQRQPGGRYVKRRKT